MAAAARLTALSLSILIAASAHPVAAQEESGPPEVFENVVRCQEIADNAQRLACFDASVAALAAAEETRDVQIASREQIRSTRRGLFGIPLPKLNLFGGDDDEDVEEEIRELQTTITSIQNSGTNMRFEVEGGAVWQKTDNAFIRDADPGQTVIIRRAALGSYIAKVDGGLAFRVKRVR